MINLLQILCSVLIKSLNKLGIEWKILYLKKNIYKSPIANSTLHSEILNAFTLRLGMRQGCPLLSPIQHHIGGSSQCSKTRKRNRRHQIGSEEVKLSLFIYDMIIYIENLMESPKKLLELISEFNKISGYKSNT